MMKFSYTLEPNDVAAYIGGYLCNTRDGKRKVLHQALAPSVTTCFVLAFLGLYEQRYGIVLCMILMFPLVFLLIRVTVLVCWKRNAAKYSSTHPDLIGRRELEITPDFIIQRTEGSESRTAITHVLSVADANDLIIVNLGATQAIIVPKRQLSEQQISALLTLKDNSNTAFHGTGCALP